MRSISCRYRFQALDPKRDVRIRLIEGSTRVLPALDERVSARTDAALRRLKVDVVVRHVSPSAANAACSRR